MRVVHSHPRWLPVTQNWMFTVVDELPEDVESHVVCRRTENLDVFSVPNLFAQEQLVGWRRAWDQLRYRLRGKTYLDLLVRQARSVGAEIVHSHFGHVGWADLGAVRKAGARHFVTFYGSDVHKVMEREPRFAERYAELFERVDRILCEGPHMAGEVVSLGAAPEKVKVQHLGVRLDGIPFRPRTRRAGEPLRVLMASSFREKKGIPDGLEAIARLRKDHEVAVTIIGDSPGHSADTEKRRIRDVIEERALHDVVELLGFQPHERFLEEAYTHHVFLAPSLTAADRDTEGGAPVSLIEVSASGMPVVSTTHCDIPNVILHERSGLLAEERDVDTLARHLGWMAEHPERWEELGRAGRRHVEEEFDASRQGLRLAGLYREVL